jgi:hypothetical protein
MFFKSRFLAIAFLASVSGVSLSETYQMRIIGSEESETILGGGLCNHRDKIQICTTGTQTCSGTCKEADINKDCGGSNNAHASSGSVYICGDSQGNEAQIDCTTTDGNQSCTRDKACICKDKNPLVSGGSCTKEDDTTTMTKLNITVTTNCSLQ